MAKRAVNPHGYGQPDDQTTAMITESERLFMSRVMPDLERNLIYLRSLKKLLEPFAAAFTEIAVAPVV